VNGDVPVGIRTASPDANGLSNRARLSWSGILESGILESGILASGMLESIGGRLEPYVWPIRVADGEVGAAGIVAPCSGGIVTP
jgi:hypothetical protein